MSTATEEYMVQYGIKHGYERGRADMALEHAIPDETSWHYDATYHACVALLGYMLLVGFNDLHRRVNDAGGEKR